MKMASREYLEEALAEAKEKLPGWAYAELVQNARARTGGKASRMLRAINRLGLASVEEDPGKFSKGELIALYRELSALFETDREGDRKKVVAAAKPLIAEMRSRRMRFDGPLKEAVGKVPVKKSAMPDEFYAPAVWDLVENKAEAYEEIVEKGFCYTTLTAQNGMRFDATLSSDPFFVAEVGERFEDGSAMLFISGEEGEMVRFASAPIPEDIPSGSMVRVSLQQNAFIGEAAERIAPDALDDVALLGLALQAFDGIGFDGPEEPRMMFIALAPSEEEQAQGQAFTEEEREFFKRKYLKPLGLSLSDVTLGFCIPKSCDTGDVVRYRAVWSEWLDKQLAKYPNTPVVALGRLAKNILGDRASANLPHPSAVLKKDSGELKRKRKALSQLLDVGSNVVDNPTQPTPTYGGVAETTGDLRFVSIAKASDLEKQIVYGVVLDPYEIDAHNDWIPPSVVENTAHGFLAESRVVGLQHSEPANGVVVESFIESYPSKEDYRKAMSNKPHKVTRRAFGSDVIKSGSWVLGVQLGDKEWEMFKAGKLTGFSIGAMTQSTDISTDAMPEIEFLDLVESA